MQETPVPGAPLVIGTAHITAEPDGQFHIAVNLNADASIASDLKALMIRSFNSQEMEVLSGSGQEIVQFVATYGTPLEVEVMPRVRPEQICRTYGSGAGEEVLRFPYTNRYTEDLTVTAENLNTLWSISGQASPVSIFTRSERSMPDGYYGFEWPISHFTWVDSAGRERASATWKLLGQEVSVDDLRDNIPFCELNGEVVGCDELATDMDNRIFQQAVSTVTALNKAAVKAKKEKLWKPVGRYRNPYFKRAAKALSGIRRILNSLPPNRYLCPDPTPPQCSQVVYPKAALLVEFDSILAGKLPKGLKHLRKLYPQLRQAFLTELGKQPNGYLSCSR